MTTKVLDFERPIVELEGKIRELKLLSEGSEEIATEISRLEEKAHKLQKERFAKLTPWEQLQLAKHPDRPYTLDYIGELLRDFVELKGDRGFADDPAIIGGIGRFEGTQIFYKVEDKTRFAGQDLVVLGGNREDLFLGEVAHHALKFEMLVGQRRDQRLLRKFVRDHKSCSS